MKKRNPCTKCIIILKSLWQKLAGHRILALNRGEKEKILTVKLESPGGGNYPLSGEKDDPQRKSVYNSIFKRSGSRQLSETDRTGN